MICRSRAARRRRAIGPRATNTGLGPFAGAAVAKILVYLRLLAARAREVGKPLTRELLREHGANTPLYGGVEGWFTRIGKHAIARGLRLEHYVVSSGNEEMIAGTKIYQQFTKVFASRYRYDVNGHAEWPAVAINYTNKTQYLFRINEGVANSWDNEPVNCWIPTAERPVPFSRASSTSR